MKPLNGGQIVILIIIGLVTVAYLSARSYDRNRDNNDYGEFTVLIEESFPMDGQKQVDLAVSSENIYVTTGTSDSFEIRYENHVFTEKAKADLMERIVIEDTGTTIKVYKKPGVTVNMNWIDSLFFYMDNGFNSNMVNGSLEVTIPSDYSHALTSTTSSGRNTAMDLTLTDAKLTASSGNIEIKNLETDKLNAAASSGRITIDGLVADGEVQTSTSSGNQNLTNIEAKSISTKASSGKTIIIAKADSLDSTSSSGNIQVEGFAGEEVELSASSGTIRFDGETEGADLTTTSGNIHFDTDILKDDYRFAASSGTINVTVPYDEAFTFESRTSSGSFKPDMDLNYSKDDDDHAKGYYENKNADAHISMSSTSGNQHLNN